MTNTPRKYVHQVWKCYSINIKKKNVFFKDSWIGVYLLDKVVKYTNLSRINTKSILFIITHKYSHFQDLHLV